MICRYIMTFWVITLPFVGIHDSLKSVKRIVFFLFNKKASPQTGNFHLFGTLCYSHFHTYLIKKLTKQNTHTSKILKELSVISGLDTLDYRRHSTGNSSSNGGADRGIHRISLELPESGLAAL